MRGFIEFLSFELRMRVRSPAVYLFTLMFALLGFGATASDAVVIGGAGGQTAINSPMVTSYMLGILSLFGLLIVVAFSAGAVVRDFEGGRYELFFTRPINKLSYLAGRFTGGIITSLVVFAGAAFGMMLGALMPWVDAERLVAFSAATYVYPLLVIVLPNIIVMGAIFFAVGTFTKRILWAYVSVAAFMVFYVVAQAFASDLDYDTIAALADPCGLATLSHVTRYWTPAEQNSSLVPVVGLYGVNRLIWLGAALALLAFTVLRFRLAAPILRAKATPKDTTAAPDRDIALPTVQLHHGWRTQIQQALFKIRVELRGIVTGTAYIVLAVFAAINVLANALGSAGAMFGTPVYPVTRAMLSAARGGLAIYLVIVVAFYAAELVWKERKVKLHEVHDALPVANWVPLASKTIALVLSVGLLTAVAVLTSIGVQLAKGYTHLEIDLYSLGLFGVSFFDWALLCVIAVFFQVIASHRYFGFGLMAVFFGLEAVLSALDFDDRLYHFLSAPDGSYSDMNGFGHYVGGMVWFRLYWGAAAVVLLLIANLMWLRGTDTRFKLRLREARRRITGWNTLLLAGAVLGFLGTGGFIYYNTHVLNEFVPGDEQERLAQVYEERYKQYEKLPQPRVTATELEVDIYPEERRVDLRGVMTLRNKTDEPIPALHVRLDKELEVRSLSLDKHEEELHDEEVGYRIYRLDEPLAAGAEMTVEFDVTWAAHGFVNSGSNTEVVANGSFFHNSRYVPHFGYDPGGELGDPDERRDRGLPEKVRVPPLEDEEERYNTYISREADWIDFKATVSTSADQIALAPGYLVDEWTTGDRRYFRYEMDAPILNLYAFLSAEFEIVRDQWNDVKIEVYHHAPHDYNVQRMIDSVKKSLDYYTTNFSPYQHRQLRIVEFPRYRSFAQSLPNTVPYSESIGFIADLRDEENIDYVFYVTAHEVAHQWWAHQVIGANVQGSTVMSETLSQYSALMVMEKEYGRDKMQKFLRYELDRYLIGRATERHRELPLVRVENQGYIHYRKGSLVMYALREYLGEETVNKALAGYIEKVGFQEPPYTTSLEFIEALREVTPPKYEYLIEDLFETITLYDNRATEAKGKELDDGRWEVELKVKSRKLRADESGAETEIALDDWIEIGVLDEEGGFLYRKQHKLTEEDTTLTLIVDEKPYRAGIDPINLFIDRDPDDNLERISF